MSDDIEVRLQVLDLCAKVFLGVVGLALTTVLGCQQQHLGRELALLQQAAAKEQQAAAGEQQRAQLELARQQAEASALELVLRHLSLINKPGSEGQQAHRIVLQGAKMLSERYNNQFMAVVLKELEVPKTSSEALQVEESTAPALQNQRWFAIMASFPQAEEAAAKSFARSLAAQLQATHSVQIYLTKISRNFAVTIDGPLDKPRATALAAEARRGGARDAFAQVDRGWTRVQ